MTERSWPEVLDEVEASLAALDAACEDTAEEEVPAAPVDAEAVRVMAATWRPPEGLGPIPDDQFGRARRVLAQLEASLQRGAHRRQELEAELGQMDQRRRAGAAYLRAGA